MSEGPTENLELGQLPLLPLKDMVVFPHMIVPVFVSEDLCMKAVEDCLARQGKIFLSAFRVPHEEGEGLESSLPAPFDVYDVGTLCTVMRTRRLPDGRMKVLVQGLCKARILELVHSRRYPVVSLKMMDEIPSDDPAHGEALVRAVRDSLEKIGILGKALSPDILMILEDIHEPGRLADLVAANLGLRVEEAQRILAIEQASERLRKVHNYLCREIEVFQMQMKIQNQAKEELGKLQKEHYIREQIKVLKHELGDQDVKDEYEVFWKKVHSLPLSQEAKEEVSRQIKRLERMHQDTSEASLTRTYIETLLALPWGQSTKDCLDIKRAETILARDHYGLEEVKGRVLEYLAVKKLNPTARSPILCFVGPPGVGKTSLGRSIAEALDRKFSRISLGGVRDEADIRGHRKTYVGAFPGRVIQSLKSAGSSNPVVMLDEIDKLGADHRGDPAAALLEVLDPEQNQGFVDHYLGVSFDLSQIMFIANANTLDTIPHALRDRLEILEVSGYSEDEKTVIARKYLVPKQVKESGLEDCDVAVTSPALQCLIRGYTRESGLRSLEKQIASVCRKIARNIAVHQGPVKGVRVTPSVVEKLLGARIYRSASLLYGGRSGVSQGMAYTSYGGEILTIETNLLPGSSRLVLTGQLGDVMKESAQTAWSYLRSQAQAWNLDEEILKNHEVHVHMPQGAVPKDGPSAGMALVTSMLSAITGRMVNSGLAMTGEISLHGHILPVGGLKEKLLAAQREKMIRVILPKENKATVEKFKIAKNLDILYVSHYDEVLPWLFQEGWLQTSLLETPVSYENLQQEVS